MPCFPLHGAVNLSIGFLCLLFVSNLAASTKEENKKDERVAVLATAELPAKSVDLAAINLTELVNGMLNTALKGTRKFFSLLSITSYSSYAFHKVSIVVYNISNLKNIDPTKFPMRYCYCLNNRTNDLTDFTALLVDIIGNSTNYLTEIFKSTSILSVSQSNDTDCVYICVMSGRTGRNFSDLWEAIEKSPVINYTFSGNVSDLLDLESILPSLIPLRVEADKVLGDTAEDTWTFKTTKVPAWAHTSGVKGKEMLWTQHPTLLKTVSLKGSEMPSVQFPLWLQTDASKGHDVSPTKMAAVRPLFTVTEGFEMPLGELPGPSPKMSTPAWTVAVEGEETTSTQFTTWQKTIGLKGSEVSSLKVSSWLQTDGPKNWGFSPTKRDLSTLLLTSYDTPHQTQPVPTMGVPLPLASPSTEQGKDALKTRPPSIGTSAFLTRPASKITKAPLQMETGNLPLATASTPPQKPGILLKVHSRCPQAAKKQTFMTTPVITDQKINPCVMELCKFFQQCLCMRQRRYSREEAMRYCIDNYSWFLRNAAYVCEKVKRMAYSNTLKQKCLASICKSI
ncbi:HERV-H LTR-associating protein 1 isoform X2 [Hemicordylus capensis]|uniref:HERV-H LTR-associating protein 1 isoform X2 n=1 Tax=Hemicordylus capensis TaxID=884348 RepID=UPI002303567F|nr:HERV-H LTR-associating protein 1 isoform X2 [Hemicordylus capensis]